MKVVLNLGNSFAGVMGDVRQIYGNDIEVIVLALRRDEKSQEFRGQTEAPLLQRTGAKAAASRVIFLDDEGFDGRALGAELGHALILMNGGTSRGGLAAVRIFDGLTSGQLINLQREGFEILEGK